MGSDSDMESLTFSDVEGEVMGEEESGDEEVSESDDEADKVPDQPKVSSMAERMAAAQAVKKSKLQEAKEEAAKAKQLEQQRLAEKEGRRKALEREEKRAEPPAQSKKAGPVAKQGGSSAHQAPAVSEKQPAGTNAKESSDESSDSYDSSSGESSSEQSEESELPKSSVHLSESSGKTNGTAAMQQSSTAGSAPKGETVPSVPAKQQKSAAESTRRGTGARTVQQNNGAQSVRKGPAAPTKQQSTAAESVRKGKRTQSERNGPVAESARRVEELSAKQQSSGTESTRKRKGIPAKLRTSVAEVVPTQAKDWTEYDSDDIPLRTRHAANRGAGSSPKRSNLAGKLAKRTGKVAGKSVTQDEPKSDRKVKSSGANIQTATVPTKKPRAPTGADKLSEHRSRGARKSGSSSVAEVKMVDIGKVQPVRTGKSQSENGDALEAASSLHKPESLGKHKGSEATSILASDAAHGEQASRSFTKTEEHGRVEVSDRNAAKGTKLQGREIEKKPVGVKRGRKAEHLQSTTRVNSRKGEEEERARDKRNADRSEKKDGEGESIEVEVASSPEQADELGQEHEQQREGKADERKKKNVEQVAKRREGDSQKQSGVEHRTRNGERMGTRQVRAERKNIDTAMTKASGDEERKEHEQEAPTSPLTQGLQKTAPTKRKRKANLKGEVSNMIAAKEKPDEELPRRPIGLEFGGDETTRRERPTRAVVRKKQKMGHQEDSASVRTSKGESRVEASFSGINPPVGSSQVGATFKVTSPNGSLKKKRKSTNVERSSSGRFKPRKAQKTDSSHGPAKSSTDSAHPEPGVHALPGSLEGGEEDQDFTFTAADQNGKEPMPAAQLHGKPGNHVIEVSDSSDDQSEPIAVVEQAKKDMRGTASTAKPAGDGHDARGELMQDRRRPSGDRKVFGSEKSVLVTGDGKEDAEAELTVPKAENQRPTSTARVEQVGTQFVAENKSAAKLRQPQVPLKQTELVEPSDRGEQRQTFVTPDGRSHGNDAVPEDGPDTNAESTGSALFGPYSDKPIPQRLSEYLPQTIMAVKDEPFQAMMFCQQLERSFWDFAEAQDNMIDGFLSLLRKRSNASRSRSVNSLPQAWASPDERQFLRRQKWCSAITSARVELRRVQEQALEDFAKKVSAARESHANALGDFIVRGLPSGGQNEMSGMVPTPKELFGSDNRGNVSFAAPIGAGASSSPDSHMNPYSSTPPVFSMAMAAQQTLNHVEYHGGSRPRNGKPVERSTVAMEKCAPIAMMEVQPTNLHSAFSVENAGLSSGDGRLVSMSGGPHPFVSQGQQHGRPVANVTVPYPSAAEDVALFPSSSPSTPMRQSAIQVAGADGRTAADMGVGKNGEDGFSHDARATDLANGMLQAAANGTTALPSAHANRTSPGPSSTRGKKVTKRVVPQRKEAHLKRFVDNTEVKRWLGDAFASLGVDCFRARSILKICNRFGGVRYGTLLDLFPFARKTMETKLKSLVSLGHLLVTDVHGETQGESWKVYTTAGAVAHLENGGT